jgi:hypothetical protein
VYSDSARAPLSPYLAEGVAFADKLGTPVIVAVDMKHIFPVTFIRSRLELLQSLKGQNVDLDQLAAAVASVRGMMLGITATDQVYGKIKVDFDQDVPLTAELAKPLLLEALANHGAMIEEFTQWQCAVNGKEITLGGYLQKSGRQRVFSPNIQAYNVRSASVYGAGVGPYGGFHAGGATAYQYAYNPKLSLALQSQQSAQIRTQERIRGNTSANLIMQGLQAETGEIRRKMTEKYQVEF